jgi:hypothetical protein
LARIYGRLWEIAELPDRLTSMEDRLQDCRQLNQRLADVTDLLAELLVPASARDHDRLRQLLARTRMIDRSGATPALRPGTLAE